MSKQEEIDLWKKFVSELPLGYLHSMFAGSVGVVEDMIRNDFAYDPLPELFKAQAELSAELKKEKEKLVEVEKARKEKELECQNYNRIKRGMINDIETLKERARLIADS